MMAKEYIEREAVLDALYDNEYTTLCPLDEVSSVIGAIPAADVVEVVRGCWVGTADGYADGELVYDMWECSECGYDADGAEEKPNWNFCPNCGAKMDGGADHD